MKQPKAARWIVVAGLGALAAGGIAATAGRPPRWPSWLSPPAAHGLRTIEVGTGRRPFFLLHGYGSSAEQWLPFTRTIRPPPQTFYILPDAPGETVPPDGPTGGRAWWRIDLESHVRPGRLLPDLSATRPAGLDDAAARVRLLMADTDRRLGIDAAATILGGFSQGAMVAADVAFRSDPPLRALVLLSGTIVDEAGWRRGMPRRAGLPVFLSHGRSDDVLPFQSALRLRDEMERAGLRVCWYPFEGGHEIPADVVVRLNQFLSELP